MYMLITVAEIPTTTQEIGELTTLTLEYAWLNMHGVEYAWLNTHGCIKVKIARASMLSYFST